VGPFVGRSLSEAWRPLTFAQRQIIRSIDDSPNAGQSPN
jgi:hypothetical protein